jgi:ornithine cyclodeaminase
MSRKTTILHSETIRSYLKEIDMLPLIEKGFMALSNGLAVVPPVGELIFEKPKGETHIKYGYIKNEPYYIVKVASGFYDNEKIGLSSSQGLMLVFSQQTGQILAILLDDGHLTDTRTAVASMITMKHLATSNVNCVGIIGTGTQAQLQLDYLHLATDCKNIMIWGRDTSKAQAIKLKYEEFGFSVHVASTIKTLAEKSQVIITTTPSQIPLIFEGDVQAGTHITALGSDTENKIELSSEILKHCDILVVDSFAQSQTRGEVYQARKMNFIDESKVIELGQLIQNKSLGRTNDQQITIADLTGVAVQDIMIATAIFEHHKKYINEH